MIISNAHLDYATHQVATAVRTRFLTGQISAEALRAEVYANTSAWLRTYAIEDVIQHDRLYPNGVNIPPYGISRGSIQGAGIPFIAGALANFAISPNGIFYMGQTQQLSAPLVDRLSQNRYRVFVNVRCVILKMNVTDGTYSRLEVVGEKFHDYVRIAGQDDEPDVYLIQKIVNGIRHTFNAPYTFADMADDTNVNAGPVLPLGEEFFPWEL